MWGTILIPRGINLSLRGIILSPLWGIILSPLWGIILSPLRGISLIPLKRFLHPLKCKLDTALNCQHYFVTLAAIFTWIYNDILLFFKIF